MKRDSQPPTADQEIPFEKANATCPARPSEHRLLKQAAALQGIPISEAFGRATRRYVAETCPEVLDRAATPTNTMTHA